MNKTLLLTLFASTLLLSACGTTPTTKENPENTLTFASGTSTSDYNYTRQMAKPTITEMTNREAMNSGFQKERSTDFLVEKEFADTYQQSCHRNGDPNDWDTPHLTDGEFTKDIQVSDVVSGNTLTLTGLRHSEQLLNLTPQQQQQVASRGRTLVGIDTLHNHYKMNYERASADQDSYDEERVQLSSTIWWPQNTAKRYPFNTLLITNDYLLHVYHKLFDNSLKYYEEQIARPTLATLSEKLYNQYLNLSHDQELKDNNRVDLLEIYDFLAAYWAIPHIFLPPNEELLELWIVRNQQHNYIESKNDLTDEQITTLIEQRTQTISKTLAPTYQKLIPQLVEKILKADEDRAQDEFLASLDSEALSTSGIILQQDYTQFKPRSHYNDSSLLKTYFMATKWLMREKFYFNSTRLTQAAMVMVSTISEKDLQEFNQLSQQIKNLVGSDDDLTIDEMRDYLKQYGRVNLPTGIVITARPREEITEQLRALHPQKIQSTHYTTPNCVECVTEEKAKSATDGFVLFGEKFTFDSYLFDLMTAGSAEKEFAEKPNMQTALIVPDILEDNALANQFVKLRLKEKSETQNAAGKPSVREDTTHTQLSSYDKVKSDIRWTFTNTLIQSSLSQNIYHKRLFMLGLLLKNPLENAPYRHFDPLYQLKNLITYMGSYTELKHDTLLYVKQAYAEMGGGGLGGCGIRIETPALPVPKGYVEAEPDFLDKLIALNAETTPYFTGTYGQTKFIEFGKALEKLKAISIQQMHNETISDEDFEWLRTFSDKTLKAIVLPTKTIGTVSQKETRGALIADIFTSELDGPLYEAIGRPALMLLMVNDINGARVVLWPVFTHYEFYGSDTIIDSDGSRYTDLDRQEQLQNEEGDPNTQIPPQTNRSDKGLSIVSRELKKWLEKSE